MVEKASTKPTAANDPKQSRNLAAEDKADTNETTAEVKAEQEATADDPTTANPVVKLGDRVAPLGTLSGNNLPPDGTGFHCGVCAAVVGKEGQHYNAEGDVVETPHAITLVVADDWAEGQNEQDRQALEDQTSARTNTAGGTKTTDSE